MIYLLVIFTALVLIGVVGRRFLYNKGGGSGVITMSGDAECASSDCASCASAGNGCGRDGMMKAAAKEVEYFDDEELDVYSGRPSDSYTDDETQQFADVMLTMRQDEVADWLRSLTLRGISLPDQIKDEALMLINE